MTVFEIIGSILLIITCVLVTVTVLFQSSSKADGISALTGGKSASASAAEAKSSSKQDGISALGGKSAAASAAEAKSNNAKLARITKVLAIVFFVVTLAVYALTIYL